MLEAADNYAKGKPVADVPPSLRVYALAKDLPGMVRLDLLAEAWELWRELGAYGAASAAEARRRNNEQRRQGRRKGRRR